VRTYLQFYLRELLVFDAARCFGDETFAHHLHAGQLIAGIYLRTSQLTPLQTNDRQLFDQVEVG